jgi:butyryl-CoA:acetate CoA-transferase
MYKVSDLQEEYKKKLVSADQAVKVVKSGDRVHYGLFNGIVVDLDRALAKRTQELFDVKVMTTIWAYPWPTEILVADPKAEHFKYLSSQFSAQDRKWNKEGCCWYVPVTFRENPKYWAENVGDFNVVMFQVAPMDKWGNFNFGPQVAEYEGILKKAKCVIVEVNEKMPICHGLGNTINLSNVDYVVHGSNPNMPLVPAKSPTEIDRKIGELIVERISSGSTLQLGVGGLPNCIGTMIADSDIDDLSVHSEMFVDAYMNLYNAGKISGNKNVLKGKMVFTFGQGTQDLYEFMNNNPVCYGAPVDWVNALEVIAANDKVVSINSCLQVDLFGQVNSESAGLQHIGGTGGQLDFVQGAFKSKGGQSFLCTPSTRVGKDGKLISNIMPMLPQGSIVTCPRTATHHIVTEYGIANLKGKSTWERSEMLINIAHPDFREELIKTAEKMGIWNTTSKITY